MPNAVFLASAAETLPGPLSGAADLVTVALPWGSLLRGFLIADPELIEGIAATLKPSGEIQLLISATDRDLAAATTLTSDEEANALAQRLSAGGLDVVDFRRAEVSDVDRISSAWARRLGIPARRPAWIYRLRPAPVASRLARSCVYASRSWTGLPRARERRLSSSTKTEKPIAK